ncbi:hypothetical protein ON010_g6962 [Phytophthora cinnamomi]|nr:hypothetical protein ON010_g6962 [Phytophthora cinnamomi]
MGKWMTIDNKRELIRKHAATPAMTQAQLAKWAKKEFRLRDPPARNTISDILRNAGAIMKEAYGQGKRRKPLKVKAPALERRLEGWIEKAEQRRWTHCLQDWPAPSDAVEPGAVEDDARVCDRALLAEDRPSSPPSRYCST